MEILSSVRSETILHLGNILSTIHRNETEKANRSTTVNFPSNWCSSLQFSKRSSIFEIYDIQGHLGCYFTTTLHWVEPYTAHGKPHWYQSHTQPTICVDHDCDVNLSEQWYSLIRTQTLPWASAWKPCPGRNELSSSDELFRRSFFVGEREHPICFPFINLGERTYYLCRL